MSGISTTVYAVQQPVPPKGVWGDVATFDTQAKAEAYLYSEYLAVDPEGTWNGRLRLVERTTTITQTNVLNVRGVGE